MSKFSGKLIFFYSLFKKKQLTNFKEEEIIKRAYEIWKSDNSKGNAEENWNAAIESLKLEQSIIRRIKTSLQRIATIPYRFT